MTSEPVTFKTYPEQTVAYALCSGSYLNVSPRLNRLFDWLKERGMQMKGAPGGRFPGTPAEAAVGTTTWELFAPVDEATAVQAADGEQIGVKRLPARELAVYRYHGPYDSTTNGYRPLAEWIAANGYAIAGPGEEWWLDDDDDVPANELRTEIGFPVTKAQGSAKIE